MVDEHEAKLAPVGTITTAAVVDVAMTLAEPISGARIEFEQLGIAKPPNSVAETGNNAALDPARPPVVDGNSLLVFFSPKLTSGTYSFRFTFAWKKDIDPVVPKPLVDGKYDGVVEAKK